MNWSALATATVTVLSGTQIFAQSPQPSTAARVSQDRGPAFEVVSIRPSSRDLYPPNIDEEDPCSAALPRLTGRTLFGGTTTLYALVAFAYNPWRQTGGACSYAMTSGLISGGPAWIKSERYAIQMLVPDGTDVAAFQRLLTTGEALDVQRMLQTMLTERFKLRVRRTTKDVPVYLMTVASTPDVARRLLAQSAAAGQGPPERLGDGIFSSYPTGQDGKRYASITFRKQSMTRMAQRLSTAAQRPVLDRTDLTGEFNFVLEFDESGFLKPTLFTAIQEQLGLKLQPSRAPVEVLEIEHAERPSEN